MDKLMPTEIRTEVERVLRNVHKNSGSNKSYLTAYQILGLLPDGMRDDLIRELGRPGEGSGKYYAAASAVSQAARNLPGIEIEFIDTSSLFINLTFCGEDMQIKPSAQVVGLYRLQI